MELVKTYAISGLRSKMYCGHTFKKMKNVWVKNFSKLEKSSKAAQRKRFVIEPSE